MIVSKNNILRIFLSCYSSRGGFPLMKGENGLPKLSESSRLGARQVKERKTMFSKKRLFFSAALILTSFFGVSAANAQNPAWTRHARTPLQAFRAPMRLSTAMALTSHSASRQNL